MNNGQIINVVQANAVNISPEAVIPGMLQTSEEQGNVSFAGLLNAIQHSTFSSMVKPITKADITETFGPEANGDGSELQPQQIIADRPEAGALRISTNSELSLSNMLPVHSTTEKDAKVSLDVSVQEMLAVYQQPDPSAHVLLDKHYVQQETVADVRSNNVTEIEVKLEPLMKTVIQHEASLVGCMAKTIDGTVAPEAQGLSRAFASEVVTENDVASNEGSQIQRQPELVFSTGKNQQAVKLSVPNDVNHTVLESNSDTIEMPAMLVMEERQSDRSILLQTPVQPAGSGEPLRQHVETAARMESGDVHDAVRVEGRLLQRNGQQLHHLSVDNEVAGKPVMAEAETLPDEFVIEQGASAILQPRVEERVQAAAMEAYGAATVGNVVSRITPKPQNVEIPQVASVESADINTPDVAKEVLATVQRQEFMTVSDAFETEKLSSKEPLRVIEVTGGGTVVKATLLASEKADLPIVRGQNSSSTNIQAYNGADQSVQSAPEKLEVTVPENKPLQSRKIDAEQSVLEQKVVAKQPAVFSVDTVVKLSAPLSEQQETAETTEKVPFVLPAERVKVVFQNAAPQKTFEVTQGAKQRIINSADSTNLPSVPLLTQQENSVESVTMASPHALQQMESLRTSLATVPVENKEILAPIRQQNVATGEKSIIKRTEGSQNVTGIVQATVNTPRMKVEHNQHEPALPRLDKVEVYVQTVPLAENLLQKTSTEETKVVAVQDGVAEKHRAPEAPSFHKTEKTQDSAPVAKTRGSEPVVFNEVLVTPVNTQENEVASQAVLAFNGAEDASTKESVLVNKQSVIRDGSEVLHYESAPHALPEQQASTTEVPVKNALPEVMGKTENDILVGEQRSPQTMVKQNQQASPAVTSILRPVGGGAASVISPSAIPELEMQLAQARPIQTQVTGEPVATAARGMVLPLDNRSGKWQSSRQQAPETNRASKEQSVVKGLSVPEQAEAALTKDVVTAVAEMTTGEDGNQEASSGFGDNQSLAQSLSGLVKPEHHKATTQNVKSTASETNKMDVPEQVVQQMKEKLGQHEIKSGSQQITLTLSPDSLGELKMNLNLQGQKLSVEIITESRVVRDAIAQHTDSLKESLARQNISMESFDVTTGGKGSGNQNQQNQQAWRELVKQQQLQQFWTSPRGYNMAQADLPAEQMAYQKPLMDSMLDIHY